MFGFKNIIFEKKSGVSWLLTMNRPAAMNALNSEVFKELNLVLDAIEKMSFSEINSVILTGAGEKAFVAGADIKELSGLTVSQGEAFARVGQQTMQRIVDCKVPWIAAVNGFALGGGLELALSCDFILASENAQFGLPEVSLGLIPGFAGTVRLAQAIGRRRALQLTMTGEMISANLAYDWGLINKTTLTDELIPIAESLVSQMSKKSPLAIQMAKESIHTNCDLNSQEAQNYEAIKFGLLFSTNDMKEGTSAFIEKRKPVFKGN